MAAAENSVMKETINREDTEGHEEVEWVEDGVEEEEASMALGVVGRLWTTRNINANALISTMKRLWNPKHGMEANCIGDKLFQFHHWKDKAFAMDNQPWHFDHHVLVMDDVKGNSTPSDMPLFFVPFWIRVYELPFKGRQKETNMRAIARKVGEYVGMDNNDIIGINKFVRLRVRIDVRKPLLNHVDLKLKGGGSKRIPIKYEKLPVFYYVCGVLGHGEKDCEEDGDECVARKFNETLRALTPWKANKGDGANREGSCTSSGRRLFITKKDAVTKEEVGEMMKEVTCQLQGVSIDNIMGKLDGEGDQGISKNGKRGVESEGQSTAGETGGEEEGEITSSEALPLQEDGGTQVVFNIGVTNSGNARRKWKKKERMGQKQ
ncbi:hypothetical protein RDABS01_021819 [Bienertia sinuspersici]